MKKLFKLLLKLAIGLVILLAAAVIAVKIMFPPEKLKAMAVAYAKDNLHREISFDSISLNVIGVTLDNFALSEESTFQQGTFVKADRLSVKVAFWPLLKKNVEIAVVNVDGLDINVIKQKDGSFNFDSLVNAFSSSETAETAPRTPAEESAPLNLNLMAHRITVNNCNLFYQDKQTGMSAGLEKLNVEIDDFDLNAPFGAVINFTTEYKEKNGPAVSVPVHITLRVFLAGLELKNAYVTANDISAAYKTVKFQLKGGVKDFTAPQADFSGTLSGINNQIFADFLPDLPNFSLPVISMNVQASADLDKTSAVIQKAALSVKDSGLNAKGTVGWGSASPTYNVSADLKADLAQLVQMTDAADGFNPGGVISGAFKATDKNNGQDVSGTVTLAGLSALYEPVTLSDTNGTIRITSLNDVACNKLTGLLNGEKFTTSFSYKNIQDVMNIVFNLDLDKLTLASFPASSSEETAEAASQTQADDKPANASGPETRMNIKASVKVGAIRVPYFEAQGFTANADLKNVTPSMTRTSGTVDFTLKPGGIRDLDTFVKQNKIVKIILLPLSIVNKVALALNVDLFPQENAAGKGQITYQSAEGRYTFTNGLMKIDKTNFMSKLTQLNASGTADFPSGALDMKVSATVLTSQTPVVIKISGTMDNPKGKLDVLNTVGSLVGGILNYKTPGKVAAGTAKTAGNVAEGAAKTTADVAKGTVNAAKDTVKALGGLFKKKDNAEK